MLPSSSSVGVAAFDLRVQRHAFASSAVTHLRDAAERHAFARARLRLHERDVIQAKHDVLRWHDDRRASWQDAGCCSSTSSARALQAGLPATAARERPSGRRRKSALKAVADQRVKLDRLAFDQGRFERLNAQTVQRRRAVEHHRVLADHLIEDIPNLRTFPFSTSFLACLTVEE
jgi:hypothetical protein